MSLRLRSLALLALVAASLSACVVVPYGGGRRGGYVAAPVVVAPYPYYGGYGGYGGHHRYGGRW